MKIVKVQFNEVGNDWSLVGSFQAAEREGEVGEDGVSPLPPESVIEDLVSALNDGQGEDLVQIVE